MWGRNIRYTTAPLGRQAALELATTTHSSTLRNQSGDIELGSAGTRVAATRSEADMSAETTQRTVRNPRRQRGALNTPL